MVHGQPPHVVQQRHPLDIVRQQVWGDAHILHHRHDLPLRPRPPGGLHSGQGLGLGADPGVIDVVPLRAPAEVEVDPRPVGELRIVQSHHAAPPPQIGKRPVGGLHLLIVGDGDLLKPGPQAHPLGEKVTVLLRVLQPVPVLVLDLLLEMGEKRQGRIGHVPVFRVVDLLPAFQAADKGQKPVVLLPLEQDPPPPGQIVVQRPVVYLAVGGEDPHPGLGNLPLAGDKDLDVVVILKGVDLVEHHLAGAHAVPALGVVGPAPHHALVPPALDQLLGVVVVPAQLGLPLRALQHLGQILHRRHRLLLVVGADVHVVVAHRVVGGQGTGPVKGNQPVLAGAPAHHGQQGLPPGRAVRPVGAVPQGQNKLLPGEKLLKREVFGQAQIVPQLLGVYPDVLLGEHPPHIGGQRVLLRAGPGLVSLHALQIPQHFRWDLTAHRRQLPTAAQSFPPASAQGRCRLQASVWTPGWPGTRSGSPPASRAFRP